MAGNIRAEPALDRPGRYFHYPRARDQGAGACKRAPGSYFLIPISSGTRGAVAQLGERRVRNAKVRSSILLGSTIPSPALPRLRRAGILTSQFPRVSRHCGPIPWLGDDQLVGTPTNTAGLCQTNLNRHAKGAGLRRSGCKLTPFGQSGGAVLLEDVAAVEVTILIEMIMDRGVGGGKLLERLHVPELCHRPLSSSERLM